MPWPISTIGITSVTPPLRSMRMNAFGANTAADAAAAGQARSTMSPPLTAAAALRKLRRLSRIARLLNGAVDRGADALVRAAAADVARHRGVDVGVGWLRRRREQRRGGHDLSRLAVAALHDFEVEPRLLQRFALRRLVDRLDGRDGAIADAAYGSDAGSARHAVDVHGAGAAQGDAAAELGARHAEHVAQHPEKRRVRVDVGVARGAVDFDRDGHLCLECFVELREPQFFASDRSMATH